MRYSPSFTEDAALKRASSTPADKKQRFNWSEALPADRFTGAANINVVTSAGPRAVSTQEIADTVGAALTDLLVSRDVNEIYTATNREFVVAVTAEVHDLLVEHAGNSVGTALTELDISQIIERALVRRNAHDVAKSLVFGRDRILRSIMPVEEQPVVTRLIRRNHQVVPWNQSKIEVAIRKAFLSCRQDSNAAVEVARAVSRRVRDAALPFIGIEEVQDVVQEELMRSGHFKVAESYILYRALQAKTRTEAAAAPAPAHETVQESMLLIKKPDGDTYFWDGSELRKRIAYASIDLDLDHSPEQIEAELRRSLFNEISAEDLKKTIVLNAKALIEKDADFAKFAGRILLSYIYEEVLGWDIMRDGVENLRDFHRRKFMDYIERGIKIDRLSPELRKYDISKLADALDPAADLEFEFLGVQTLYDRYLIVDKTTKPNRRLETPQFFWMRVAMGLFHKEKIGREEHAIRLYTMYKSRRFCSSTPTLFNSGTLHSQLSSCYLYKVDDTIESIMIRGIAENAFLSKWAGGLGGSWTSVRGTGSYIKGTNGESQGIIPFLKLHNDQLVAVNQGGKRRGSGCAYLETWHNDMEDFLELRRNTGDDRRRCHDMNTANWIPDLFMKRMEARQDWTLFRSNETPDLHETYGAEFERRYEAYEKLGEQGKIIAKKIPAIDMWKKMLQMIFETGHPWITFKDPCNVRSPQDHVGVIHSSNLCCITADQRVVTAEGLLTIGELYAKARKLVTAGGSGDTSHSDEPVNTVMGRSGPVQAGPMLLPRPDAPIVRIITKEGYTHKVTPDHKVWVVDRGWVEAQELVRGDHIEIQQSEGLWGATECADLALLAGLIAGDGTFMVREGTTSALIDIWAQEYSLIPEIEAAASRVLSGSEIRTTSSLTPKFTGDEYKRRLASAPLARVLAARGFTRETKLVVPEFVWSGTRATAAAYLRGLYATDATVEASGEVTTCSLASVSREFLAQIQILLANFGIKASLTKMRDAGMTNLPDGNGGEREYWQAELFRLHVTSIRGCRILENLTGLGALRQNARFLSNLEKPGYAQKMHATFEALEQLPNEDAYCLRVFTEEHSWTVNGLITKNTEITLNTSADETAVCNLGSIILDQHLKDNGEIDHAKLRDTIRIAVRALDNVIDINYYPTQAAQTSNSRHRPVGMGVMGLQDCLYKKNISFASQEAVEFNDEIMEAVAYYAYEASSDLAAEQGAYSSYKGSKWDRGLLPQDTVDLLEKERGVAIEVPRGGKMDWTPVRAKIAKQGMRNSNVLAIAPTATISNIMGSAPCIEPTYKNLFVKSNLSGEFIELNTNLVRDLKKLGKWNADMVNQLKYFDGELADIGSLPAWLKDKYKTAFGIPFEYFIEAAARRQKWIDQAQSVNLFLGEADLKTLSHMYRMAWRKGLKTTYYLRTLGASNIEKATTDTKKEIRGVMSESGVAETPAKKVFSEAEKNACSIEAMRNGGTCEACQ